MRLLLAEDDLSLGDTIRSWLKLDGYTVDWVTCGEQAHTALSTTTYECLLLDRNLPKRSGDVLLGWIRRQPVSLPVLMLTARDSVEDRIFGLDLGADDYIVKPFELAELSARIRSALRSRGSSPDSILQYGAISLNDSAKRVTLANQDVALTAKEFAILRLLMRRPSHVVSRRQIEEALYGWEDTIASNAIEVHICSLRRKLGTHAIKTIRRLGYSLSD